jgi:DNA-binding CsgD family transcriptional regulator
MQAHDTAYRAALAQGQHGAALRHHQQFHEAYARCVNGESATKARLLAVQHEVDMVRAEARHQQLENARLTEALAHISARLAGAPTAPGALQAAVRPEDLQPLGLTPREAEVLYWVTQGKTNEDVATILSASLSTVKKHLASVYRKLGVENRTAAANRARQRVQGLVKAPV